MGKGGFIKYKMEDQTLKIMKNILCQLFLHAASFLIYSLV